MTCNVCGLEHRGWVSCAKAKAEFAKTVEAKVVPLEACVNKVALTQDRHKPGYMRDYMRKRRAK